MDLEVCRRIYWSATNGKGLAKKLSCDDASQRAFVDQVLNHELSLKYPVNSGYKTTVLRAYLARIDEEYQAVDEELLTHYLECCNASCTELAEHCGQQQDTELSHVIYCLPSSAPLHVALRKSFSDVGETIWAAAFAMSSYALHRLDLRGKRVLELGSGTGLSGLCIARSLEPSCVVLSDYLESVLSLLRRNAAQCGDVCRVQQLDWFQECPPVHQLGGPFDVIVGADLCYDVELAEPLARTCASLCGAQEAHPQIFLATTLRSENTFLAFQEAFHRHGFFVAEVADQSCVDSEIFHFDATAPMLVQQLIHSEPASIL